VSRKPNISADHSIPPLISYSGLTWNTRMLFKVKRSINFYIFGTRFQKSGFRYWEIWNGWI